MADYPCNFQYHPETTPPTISYKGVTGANTYQIEQSDDIHPWAIVYNGSNTEFACVLDPGEYSFKGKSKNETGWGSYSPPEKITVG